MENKEKQKVICAWCKKQGDSPVKKILKIPGKDYPLECRDCGAIGIVPIKTFANQENAN